MKKDMSKGAPSPDIATRAELNRLLENRRKPTPERTLTPDSATTVAVNKQVEAQDARRAAYLQERLNRVRQGFERDHARGLLKDRAKTGFERTR